MAYALRMEDGILMITFSGTLTNEDLSAGGDEVGKLEQSVSVVPHRIADLRPVRRVEIDFDGVYAFASSRRRLRFTNPFKTAIIVSDIVHFGFARMFQTLNDHPQISISIFGNDADAMSWLKMPGHAPPPTEWRPQRS